MIELLTSYPMDRLWPMSWIEAAPDWQVYAVFIMAGVVMGALGLIHSVQLALLHVVGVAAIGVLLGVLPLFPTLLGGTLLLAGWAVIYHWIGKLATA